MTSKKATIGELFYVTDFVANGSFASLRENVKYLYEPSYAILIRLTDSTKSWNGEYVYVDKASYDFLAKSKVFPRDLVISNVGEPGVPFIVPDLGMPMTLGPNSILLRPLNNDISTEFIYYLIKSPEGQRKISKIVSNTTIKKFNKTNFRNLELPLPRYEDQLQIAKLLSKAENLIAQRKESIRLLDEFLKSTFLEIFGDPFLNPMKWKKMCLNEICISKGQYGSGASAVDYSCDKPRYVRITDINEDGSLNADLKSPSTDPREWDEYKLNVGDILFARSGATVGKTYMHSKLYGECIFAGYLIRFIPKKELMLPTFLLHFTRTTYYKSWILDNQSVMAQPNINANQYGNNLKVIVPPIDLQTQFAQIVEKTEAIKTQYQQSLIELENLYGSLSQRAFKGELKIKRNETIEHQ